jgi:thiol-disulfide isomerase/thioredoxin
MKKILFILAIAAVGFASCDKVQNPYPPSADQGDWSLYPDGDSAYYAQNVWPTFTTNTNTDRNVLIEDFTGHTCTYCPAAAALAHQLEEDNSGRVFVSTIHAGPNGQVEGFQAISPPYFLTDFTNPTGLAIGYKFGLGTPGSPFQGNPGGAVSRKDHGNGYPVLLANSWANATTTTLTANELKVNIQAVANYYPSTRGLFVHTEVDVLDGTLANDLYIVVQLHEDSLVAPQKYPTGTFPEADPYDHIKVDYVHRDLLRGTIDGKTFGTLLDASNINATGQYNTNYIYELPAQYDASNMHLLIYVRDAVTDEIYQVIKKHL